MKMYARCIKEDKGHASKLTPGNVYEVVSYQSPNVLSMITIKHPHTDMEYLYPVEYFRLFQKPEWVRAIRTVPGDLVKGMVYETYPLRDIDQDNHHRVRNEAGDFVTLLNVYFESAEAAPPIPSTPAPLSTSPMIFTSPGRTYQCDRTFTPPPCTHKNMQDIGFDRVRCNDCNKVATLDWK